MKQVLAFLFFSVFIFPLYAQSTDSNTHILMPLRVGDHAPDIVLPDVSGHIQKLSSFKGHVTFVYFWSSGCGFCLKENKDLAYSYKKFHEEGFEMLGISLDKNASSWAAALHRSELRYPEVIDTAGMASKSVADYGVTSLPFNFLIDQYGDILMVNVPSDELYSILAIIFE